MKVFCASAFSSLMHFWRVDNTEHPCRLYLFFITFNCVWCSGKCGVDFSLGFNIQITSITSSLSCLSKLLMKYSSDFSKFNNWELNKSFSYIAFLVQIRQRLSLRFCSHAVRFLGGIFSAGHLMFFYSMLYRHSITVELCSEQPSMCYHPS